MTENVQLDIGGDQSAPPEGHADAMAHRFDNQGQPPPPANNEPQRPENVPEKFWKDGKVDTEGLLQAHGELETKLGANTLEPERPDPKALESNNEPGLQGQLGIESDSWARYTREAGGEGLSDESYTELAAKGLDRQLVDTYIEGQKAVGERIVSSAKSMFSGDDATQTEQYGTMTAWAQENYTPEQAESFNAAMNSGSQDKAAEAFRNMKSNYENVEGVRPSLVSGDAGRSDGGDTYASMQQVTTDMKTPLYKTDPAERARVHAKLDRSNI